MDSGTRIVKIGLGLLGAVLVIVVLIALVQGFGQRVQPSTVPSTFAATAPFGTNSLVFSNGQALAIYNYMTGHMSLLSPTGTGLNSIDSISASPNGGYVLFHDGRVDSNGSLATQLSQQGLDPSVDYWWVYSVQEHTFRPLPHGTLLAKLDNDHVYALSTQTNNEAITTYTTTDLSQVSMINVLLSSNFLPTENGFLLQTPSGEVLSTKDGVVNQLLFPSATLVGVTANDQQAVAVVNRQGSTRSLVAIKLPGGTTTTIENSIASNIVNLPVWASSGTVLYANNRGNLVSYSLATSKTTSWRLGGALSGVNPVSMSIALVGPTTAVMKNDVSGQYYLVGHALAPTTALR